MADLVKVIRAVGERIFTIEVDRQDLALQTRINGAMAEIDKRRPGQPMLDDKGKEMSVSYDEQAVRIANKG